MSRRVLVVATLLISGVAGSTFGSIAGLPAANARTAGVVIGKAHGGYTPEPTGRRTITILAVGSDARPGQNPLRSRADSIHVIFLQPRKGQAVIVGDRLHDVAGAHAHDLPAIGVTWGIGSRAELVEAGADAIVDAPAELPRVCGRLLGPSRGSSGVADHR